MSDYFPKIGDRVGSEGPHGYSVGTVLSVQTTIAEVEWDNGTVSFWFFDQLHPVVSVFA